MLRKLPRVWPRRTVGCEDVITGDILEQLFIDAIEDMLEQLFIDAIQDITSPVINSSSSVALLTSISSSDIIDGDNPSSSLFLK